MVKAILSLFLLGFSFGMGPCISSCGPILLSYIAGTKKNIAQGIIVYILFSFARIIAYVVLGLAVFFLGRFAEERLFGGVIFKYVLFLGGLFVIFSGILMVIGERINFRLCNFLHRNVLERDKKSIIILGFTVGLLPCAPLLAALSYVGLIAGSWAHSVVYSISFGIGTVLSPLILLVIFAGFIPKFLSGNGKIYRLFSAICGLIIVFLGTQLLVRTF